MCQDIDCPDCDIWGVINFAVIDLYMQQINIKDSEVYKIAKNTFF
jgi:hypothetical protein